MLSVLTTTLTTVLLLLQLYGVLAARMEENLRKLHQMRVEALISRDLAHERYVVLQIEN